jgi:hypothetical protein
MVWADAEVPAATRDAAIKRAGTIFRIGAFSKERATQSGSLKASTAVLNRERQKTVANGAPNAFFCEEKLWKPRNVTILGKKMRIAAKTHQNGED